MLTINAYNVTSQDCSDKERNLDDPSNFLNRELSWIRFNARILEEAKDQLHPLLERVKFIAICGSNLDEFFMTRIPRLMKKISKRSDEKSMDGMTLMEQIDATRREIIPLIRGHADCWANEIMPILAKEDINILPFKAYPKKRRTSLREFLRSAVIPALKSPTRSFDVSSIENLHISLFVSGFAKEDAVCVLDVPTEKFGRLIRIKRETNPNAIAKQTSHGCDYFFLEDLIANNLDLIFPNEKNLSAWAFRLTRNGEIEFILDESTDFLNSVQKSLSKRRLGFPTRLEFEKNMPESIRNVIASQFRLPDYLIYEAQGPLGLVDLWQLHKLNRTDLKDKTFAPSILPLLTPEKDLFTAISKRDIVLYHPYDSFEVIVDLLKEAAADPDVLQICITMYRMDRKSPVVDALMEAAKNGQKVFAIVEVKAKFDEENNILMVSKLKEAGVNTVYNFPNLKVHAKLCLIVRREKQGLVRYSHIGSGNYNAVTAKIYGDIGYLTANQEVGMELEELFGILINGLQEKEFKHFLAAPKTLKSEILKRINREITFHRETGRGYIAFKLNNLEEKDIIKALYKASMAGIKIDLNVRALCCLKPGIPGISDNISVISIVGRFLEHARIYYFQDGANNEILIGSSDMMFRNLNERVEVLFSVPDPRTRECILHDMLLVHLRDNMKARKLLPDGTYQRVKPKEGQRSINSQFWLIQNRGIWHEYATHIPKM